MDGKKLDPNPPESGDLELRQALAGLAEAVRRRVRQHPGGHLLLERAGQLELPLKLPLLLRNGDLERLSKAASDLLDREVQRLVSERASFRPGHVFCLRCSRADCDHSSPHGSREVFTGYGPSGVPRFAELPAWLLEKQDPDVDLLYQPEASRFLTRVVSSSELEAALLPSFRSSESGLRLHGQVVAGWYRGSGADGHPIQLALSFQVVSLRLGRGSRRFGLNLVGVGADGESLERFCHRLGTVPWSQPVAWAQSILSSLSAAKKGQQGQHERRIEGLLAGLALRLEKDRRSEGRKTLHARERHAQGDRPTRMALADLARAQAEEAFLDRRRDTLVILGERGRAHVFNRQGKLVTSIRFTPEAIERRKKEEIWRPALPEELASLRSYVAGQPERDGGPSVSPRQPSRAG